MSMKVILRMWAVLAAMVLLSACAQTLRDSHGYVPDDTLLKEVKVGIDTKDTTGRILGRPGTRGIIDDRGCY